MEQEDSLEVIERRIQSFIDSDDVKNNGILLKIAFLVHGFLKKGFPLLSRRHIGDADRPYETRLRFVGQYCVPGHSPSGTPGTRKTGGREGEDHSVGLVC